MDIQNTDKNSVVLPDSLAPDAAYVEEVGALVFESALMQYFADATPEQIEAFEAFVAEEVASETFMTDLCACFPEFEKLLIAEMEVLNNDLTSVYPNAAS